MSQGEMPSLPVRVLCVDDEPAHLELLKRLLKPMVQEIIPAENGEDGFRAYLQGSPDIVITDLFMPGINGLALCRMIRESGAKTQLILQTSFSSSEALAEAIDVGVNQFLPKPFTRASLYRALARCHETVDLERRLSEEHHRAQILASALEQSKTGVIILGPDGVIECVNLACTLVAPCHPEELVGRSVNCLHLAPDLPSWLKQVAECGSPVEVEVPYGQPLSRPGWLRLRVSRLVGRQERTRLCLTIDDISDRKEAEHRLLYQATHDSLTGLHNRSYFEEELHRVAVGRNFPVTLMIADLDGLKQVNDGQGHEAGDRLILEAARLLRGAFRASDVVARIGGDEFGVILPGATGEVAEGSLRRAIDLAAQMSQEGEGSGLSFSFGCATARTAADIKEIFREADSRMYRQKTGKRPRHLAHPGSSTFAS
ncbi:diguanylate cyclase [Geomonas sp. Red276]